MHMHISLAPETLFSIWKIQVTNSLLSSFIISFLLILIICSIALSLRVFRVSRFQIFLELAIGSLLSISNEILHTKSLKITSFLFTCFLFILASNIFGLLPIIHSIGFIETEENKTSLNSCIKNKDCYLTTDQKILTSHEFKPLFRAPTSDVSFTLALAIISVLATNILGFKSLGFSYLRKYLDFSSPMGFIVGLMELLSETGKIVSFSFRLFGNIFAGEVLLIVITGITYGLATLPFFALEVFVSLIQAFVFFVLTCVFISLAIEKH